MQESASFFGRLVQWSRTAETCGVSGLCEVYKCRLGACLLRVVVACLHVCLDFQRLAFVCVCVCVCVFFSFFRFFFVCGHRGYGPPGVWEWGRWGYGGMGAPWGMGAWGQFQSQIQ